MRIPPEGFVAELQRRFGAQWTVKWSDLYARWVVVGPSASGQLVEQVWGWYRKWNPARNAYEPVPVGDDGIPLFRDLDFEAQGEILANMERSYLFNRHDADQSIAKRMARISRENERTRVTNVQRRAETYRLLLNEVNIKRPGWRRQHQRPDEPVLVAGAAGVFRTRHFDHT
jgi:hypothetical protein